MFGGLMLLSFSLVLVAFAGIHLWNCFGKGVATAYGHAYPRAENPGAFRVSATCSLLAVLIGLALSFVALGGLLGAF